LFNGRRHARNQATAADGHNKQVGVGDVGQHFESDSTFADDGRQGFNE
jgi:hypothetical protein